MNKPTVFVIMPFSDDYLKTFEFIKEKLSDELTVVNANNKNMKSIMKDVIEGINNADYIIADLTLHNSNVYYELGVAHTLDKNVILITQRVDDLPFDVHAYRVLEYQLNPWAFPMFVEELRSIILNPETEYGNPVSDFLVKKKVELVYNKVEDNQSFSTVISEDNYEKGILDYISEITEDTNGLTVSVKELDLKMNDFNSNVTNKTQQINNIKSSNNNQTLINKIIDNLANDMTVFSNDFDDFNSIFDINWTRISHNYEGLLDNRFAKMKNNYEAIGESIATLVGLKEKLQNNYTTFENLIKTYQGCLGYKNKLDYAITKMTNSIMKFLIMLDEAKLCIDKIEKKYQAIYC